MWTELARILVQGPDGTARHVIEGEHIAEMAFGNNSVRVAGFFLADNGTAVRRRDPDHFELPRTGEVFIRVKVSAPAGS